MQIGGKIGTRLETEPNLNSLDFKWFEFTQTLFFADNHNGLENV